MKYLPITESLMSEMKRYLSYDPERGLFVWIKITSKRVHVGDLAGRINNAGHLGISFNGVRYQAHRLAWGFTYGEVPEDMEIDHKDEDKLNNRISNLRLATKKQNSCNRGAPSNNTSGLKGVAFHKAANKWEAYVNHLGVKYYLGLFETPEEAGAVAAKRRDELHGEYSKS